jgi:hypothetical protein
MIKWIKVQVISYGLFWVRLLLTINYYKLKFRDWEGKEFMTYQHKTYMVHTANFLIEKFIVRI